MRTFEVVNICERLVVVHILLRAGIFVFLVLIHSLARIGQLLLASICLYGLHLVEHDVLREVLDGISRRQGLLEEGNRFERHAVGEVDLYADEQVTVLVVPL